VHLYLLANGNKLQRKMPSDPSEVLDKVKLFLSQQAELYGDEMFISGQHSAVSNQQLGEKTDEAADHHTGNPIPAIDDSQSKKPGISYSSTEQDMSLKQKPKTIKVSEEEGLFEGTVLKSEWKIDPHWHESDSLEILKSRVSGCLKCRLGSTRKNFVFGVGNPNAKLVLIGEAPGADEDEQGEPFVGRAGQLLNKILVAVQLRREDVYICNILKCRPPNNRDPLPDEAESCEPFLKKQLEVINPKLILCLGRIAGQTLLKTNATLSELRNNVYVYQGIKVLVTFHPAALLRNPNWKRPAWEDVQKMKKMYDEA
jgi:uracil-DNA glycosylase family 4